MLENKMKIDAQDNEIKSFFDKKDNAVAAGPDMLDVLETSILAQIRHTPQMVPARGPAEGTRFIASLVAAFRELCASPAFSFRPVAVASFAMACVLLIVFGFPSLQKSGLSGEDTHQTASLDSADNYEMVAIAETDDRINGFAVSGNAGEIDAYVESQMIDALILDTDFPVL